MTDDYAPQYKKPCVLLDESDNDPQAVIDFAEEIGAIFWEDDEHESYVVQFPGRPQELYTAAALRRSFNAN